MKPNRLGRIRSILFLAACVSSLWVVGTVTSQDAYLAPPATIDRPVIVELHDRDSESWRDERGVAYRQGGIRFGTDRVTATAGQQQRMNPAVLSNVQLSNAKVFIYFPSSIVVSQSKAWRPQGNDVAGSSRYSAILGLLNPGERRNAFEAIYFTVPAESFVIGYVITAQELTPPVRGKFVVTVRAR